MMSMCRERWRLIAPCLFGVMLMMATVTPAQKTSETSPSGQSTNTITGHLVIQGGENASGAVAMAMPIGIIAQGRNTTVDSSGSFKFDALEAGVYSISAYLPGYVFPPPASPEESRRYYHTGDSVTLTLVKGGVVTGTVMTATNGPVVAAAVRAIRIKDLNGQPEPAVVQIRDRQTDDRGVYRFYGLVPGIYLISAGGQGRIYGGILPGAYDDDSPTYAPSSTRDTATEVIVRSGEAITADIQYQNESGKIVSGTLAGLIESNSFGSIATGTVTLTEVRSHATLMSVGANSLTGSTFTFNGVPDGEYELFGQQYLPSREVLVSEPRRIRVEGANVSGIKLSIAPLGSISGHLVLENSPPADCVSRRDIAAVEALIIARRFKPEAAAGKTAKSEAPDPLPIGPANPRADSVPDAKGDFVFRNLRTGLYRIESELPGAGWYLRAIAIGTQSIPPKPSEPNAARDGISLKPGERVSGLTVTITEGAASLRGRVSVNEGQTLPSGLFVYLVPAERESRDDVLRFFEARADNDGTFAVGNIAPGKYWILARPANEGGLTQVKFVQRDSALRAQILREAEGGKKEISFKPCARTIDYDLSYAFPTAAPKQ